MAKTRKPRRATPWGGGNVVRRESQDGTVSHQARWQELDARGHTRRRAKTFHGDDGEQRAQAFLRELGRTGASRSRRAPSDMTVAQLIDETLDRAADRLSDRTILTYRSRSRKMIEPYIGGSRLIDLETIDVQRWIDRLVRDGFKASTIHAAVAVLFSAFRDAKLLGMIDQNVVQGIRRPRIAREATVAWTRDEARRFLAVVKDDPIYGVFYRVALATGMRPGELRALQWRDVDLERLHIYVNRTLTKDRDGREVSQNSTKRGKGRAIAIPISLAAQLKRHRAHQAARRLRADTWHDLDLVFDRGNGQWISQNSWRDTQLRYCKVAGVPFIRAHDLRHTSASLELAAGTHPKVVADRLGHASIEITLDLYSHVDPALQRAAAEALSSQLFDDEDDVSNATT